MTKGNRNSGWRRRARTVTLVLLAASVAVLAAGVLYLYFGDLSVYRDTVARLASDALGREVRIAGEFTPDIGVVSRLTATEVSLANPSWSSEPEMVTVDRLMIEIDLWSLVSGPPRVVEATVSGARVLLEDRGDGRVNWAFASTQEASRSKEPVEIVVEKASVRDLDFAFRSPTKKIVAGVQSLDVLTDDTGVLDLDVEGQLENVPVKLSGSIDSLPGLLAGGPVRPDLTGRLGDVSLSAQGSLGDLKTLAGTDLVVTVRGGGLTELTHLLGLGDIETGEFEVVSTIRSSADGFDIGFDAAGTDLEIGLDASVDSVLAPSRADVTVSAHGPSASAVASLAGIDNLPDAPFDISGGVAWHGWPVTFNGVDILLGANTLTIDGVLGAPPLMEGTQIEIRGSGPDAVPIGRLVGLDLPAGAYSVAGRVLRRETSLHLEDVEVELGRSRFHVTGVVGDPPAYEGTDLSATASGPDLSAFQRLAGIDLPPLPFDVTGRFIPGSGAIELDGVRGRIGGSTVRVGGRLSTRRRIVGSHLSIDVEGDDSSLPASMLGLDGAPSLPYRVAGKVDVEGGGARLHGVRATLGDLSLSGEGTLSTGAGLSGTDLRFELAGPDLSKAAALIRPVDLPSLPFRAGGAVRVGDGVYDLDGVTATVDDLEIALQGRVGGPPDFDGTDATLEVHGPRLTTIGALLGREGWPGTAVRVDSRVRFSGAAADLDDVAIDLGCVRAEGSGTVLLVPDLVGSSFEIGVHGDDLDAVRGLVTATGLSDLPELPREVFSAEGRVNLTDRGYEAEDVVLTLGDATASFEGSIGSAPDFVGTDLHVDVHGPNASLVSAVTGVSIPMAPFRVFGRVNRHEDGVLFEDFSLQLGHCEAEFDGNIGALPTLVGTDIQVHVQGPGTALIQELADLPRLPDLPFDAKGQFTGRPEAFSMTRFEAQYGDSDVAGSFRADLTEPRPRIEADFRSGTVDLRPFFPPVDEDEHTSTEAPGGDSSSAEQRRVIPDRPVAFPWLEKVDGKVRWTADFLEFPLAQAKNLDFGIDLLDGTMRIDPISMTGEYGGVFTGTTVVGRGDRGITVRLRLAIDNARLRLSKVEEDHSRWPALDLDVNIDTFGHSTRDFASHANGWFAVVLSDGVVSKSIMDRLAADVLVELLKALNPFSAGGTDDTHLDCAVGMLDVRDGVVVLDPVAIQTERVTIIGDGSVDLSNEKLKLDWITKPRRGLGLSASTITNPYIRLGGTLAEPSVELKPLDAAVSTGAAVATMGLSMLGRGLWNRITSGAQVCKKAIEKAQQRLTEE